MILCTCARCCAEYEWGVHLAFFAERAGLGSDQIRATVCEGATHPVWSPEESLLIRLVDVLHDTAEIPDERWGDLPRPWGSDQLVELMVLAGFYHAISYVVNGTRVVTEATPR